jgi:phage-related holin
MTDERAIPALRIFAGPPRADTDQTDTGPIPMPHRFAALKQLAVVAPPDAAALMCSTLAACAAFLFGGTANLVLAVLCVTFALLDMTSGTLRAFIAPGEKAEGRKFLLGFARKVLHAHLVGACVALDLTFMYGIPGTYEVFNDLRPWTRLGLLVFIGYEGRSLLRNVALVREIPRKIEQVFSALSEGSTMQAAHALDEMRAPPGRAPTERWTDPTPPVVAPPIVPEPDQRP